MDCRAQCQVRRAHMLLVDHMVHKVHSDYSTELGHMDNNCRILVPQRDMLVHMVCRDHMDRTGHMDHKDCRGRPEYQKVCLPVPQMVPKA